MQNVAANDFLDVYARLDDRVRRLEGRGWDFYDLGQFLCGGWSDVLSENDGGEFQFKHSGFWDTGDHLVFNGWIALDGASLTADLPSLPGGVDTDYGPIPAITEAAYPTYQDGIWVCNVTDAWARTDTTADLGKTIPFDLRTDDLAEGSGIFPFTGLRMTADTTNNPFWVKNATVNLMVAGGPGFSGFRLGNQDASGVVKGGVPINDAAGYTHANIPFMSYWTLTGMIPHAGRNDA